MILSIVLSFTSSPAKNLFIVLIPKLLNFARFSILILICFFLFSILLNPGYASSYIDHNFNFTQINSISISPHSKVLAVSGSFYKGQASSSIRLFSFDSIRNFEFASSIESGGSEHAYFGISEGTLEIQSNGEATRRFFNIQRLAKPILFGKISQHSNLETSAFDHFKRIKFFPSDEYAPKAIRVRYVNKDAQIVTLKLSYDAWVEQIVLSTRYNILAIVFNDKVHFWNYKKFLKEHNLLY